MISSNRDKKKAFILSLLLHIIFISTLTAYGFFLQIEPQSSQIVNDAIDIRVLDTEELLSESSVVEQSEVTFMSADDMSLPTKKNTLEENILQESFSDRGMQKENNLQHTDSYGKGINDSTGIIFDNNQGAVNGSTKSVERIEATCLAKGVAVYPEDMRTQGVEGVVRICFYVSIGGSIESIEVIQSSGYAALDRAAVQAAWQYRFSSASQAGVFTDSFIFKLIADDW